MVILVFGIRPSQVVKQDGGQEHVDLDGLKLDMVLGRRRRCTVPENLIQVIFDVAQVGERIERVLLRRHSWQPFRSRDLPTLLQGRMKFGCNDSQTLAQCEQRGWRRFSGHIWLGVVDLVGLGGVPSWGFRGVSY